MAEAYGLIGQQSASFSRASMLSGSGPLMPLAPIPGLPLHQIGTRPRRPVDAADKQHVCEFDGCGKTFYQKQTMRRHQREKHREWYDEHYKYRERHGRFNSFSYDNDGAMDMTGKQKDAGGLSDDPGDDNLMPPPPVNVPHSPGVYGQ
jgi:hypothetical protein